MCVRVRYNSTDNIQKSRSYAELTAEVCEKIMPILLPLF